MQRIASASTCVLCLRQAAFRGGLRQSVSARPLSSVASASRRPTARQAAPVFGGLSRRNLFVQTEATPNDDALKFLPGQQLTPEGGTYEFLTASSALPSPLATALFGVEGVKSVFFGPDFIAVNKQSDASWALMKPEIYSMIIEHFTSGQPLFKDHVSEESDTTIYDTDTEVVAMIKELLDTRVRPAIREDGGDLNYLGFDEGTGIVKLSLKGSCRGCASSAVTLKSGIERMLMHYVPEVKEVQQVLGQEEEVALDEFAKLENRLRSEGKSVEI